MKQTIELLLNNGDVQELLRDMKLVSKFEKMYEKEILFPEYFELSYGMNENMTRYNFNAIKGEENYQVKQLGLSNKNIRLRDDIIYDIGLKSLGYGVQDK